MRVYHLNLHQCIILLDRDGVLNSVVVDPEHGTIDSPLHPSQVRLYPWVPEALAMLSSKHFQIAICTNQPAFAKGKTTKENLIKVHQKIVNLSEAGGGKILTSHICFHRQEDQCMCRKPKTGLLEAALFPYRPIDNKRVWMVGDGVHDIRAGQQLSINTAFIGSKKWDAQKVFDDENLQPTLWVENLLEFSKYVINSYAFS